MKKYILPAILLWISVIPSSAQLEGDWYGLISRPNRSSSDIVVHVQKNQNAYEGSVDFPSDNKTGEKPAEFIVSDAGLFLVIAGRQLALDGRWDPVTKELRGDIVFNGKPFPITLSHTPVKAAPVKAPAAATSVFNDGLSVDIESPRTIEPGKSLFIEELTWIDVRDAKQQGKTTVIIATGGVEQSGPYVAMGKHNYVLKLATESIARKLGNALIAPIVPFVPEGSLNPPSGHVKYPGTISLQEGTYEALLDDIATSYLAEGFKTIIFLGDSGGNQWGMYVVAQKLSRQWKDRERQVVYIPEYYDNERLGAWLKKNGIAEVAEGIHDNFKVTAQIAALNPELVRAPERIKAGKFSINGVQLAPLEKTIEFGKRIVDYQSDVTVEAIQKKLAH